MGVKFLKLSVVIFEENKVNSYLTKVVSSCSASSHQYGMVHPDTDKEGGHDIDITWEI